MKNKDVKYTYENDCLMLYREAMNDCMNKPNLLFLQCKVSEYDENLGKYSLKFNEESRTSESFKQQCELFSESTVNDIIKNKLNSEYVFTCEDLTEEQVWKSSRRTYKELNNYLF